MTRTCLLVTLALSTALNAGLVAGVLTALTGAPAPAAILAGGGAAGTALLLFCTVYTAFRTP
jgi:hypothetical protein